MRIAIENLHHTRAKGDRAADGEDGRNARQILRTEHVHLLQLVIDVEQCQTTGDGEQDGFRVGFRFIWQWLRFLNTIDKNM